MLVFYVKQLGNFKKLSFKFIRKLIIEEIGLKNKNFALHFMTF